MALIKDLTARQILNSKGEPTIEVKLTMEGGETFTASCPSGTSRSSKEALELTDKDYSRFQGKEVNTAVRKVNEVIRPAIKGINPIEQGMIDRKMIDLDGTPNKANLGVNTMLPISIAVSKAGAKVAKVHLFDHLNRYLNDMVVEAEDFKISVTDYKYKVPLPAFNLINGGKHASTRLAFQEFLFVPQQSSPDSFWEKLRVTSEAFHHLGQILIKKNLASGFGDEGGYAALIDSPKTALDLILEAAAKVGLKPEQDFILGVDVAASSIDREREPSADFIKQLIQKYPLRILEDPFREDAWETWAAFTQEVFSQITVVGDDLIATNPDLLYQAIKLKAINGVVIKPNQIGTVTETLRVAKIAKAHNIKLIVSHRSKETNDDFIADLATAVGADYIKAGAPNRGERVAKYNKLLEIDTIIS